MVANFFSLDAFTLARSKALNLRDKSAIKSGIMPKQQIAEKLHKKNYKAEKLHKKNSELVKIMMNLFQ